MAHGACHSLTERRLYCARRWLAKGKPEGLLSHLLIIGSSSGSCHGVRLKADTVTEGVIARASRSSLASRVSVKQSISPFLPRRRKAHMRAIALQQPLRFLRPLFSRGSARARSGNGAYNAPFPSSKAVKATLWLCQESAFSPSSQKISAEANLFWEPYKGGAARPQERARGGRSYLIVALPV